MDKQTINHPPRKHVTEDLKAELGIDLWWFTLAEDLGDLLNEAVSAGMPPEIAQEAYKDVVAKALPSAMSVKGKENKDKRNETESWVCMTCKSKFAIPKHRVDGQRCFRCEGPIMPVNTRARIYQELLREGKISINEVRAEEESNLIGNDGDERFNCTHCSRYEKNYKGS